MIDLEGGPCVAKRLSGCGSGTEYLAVTPWGDLYPCHQFVGNEDFLLGNVDEGTNVRISVMNLSAAMFMRKKNAVTVLQNSIAVADVQQTPTISMEISTMHTTSDVHFRKSVLNAQS